MLTIVFPAELASHLLEKMYVDNRSVAAFTLLSRSGKFDTKTGMVAGTNGTDSKLQLQRKLQEANIKQTEQQKRKLSEQEILIGKRSKLGEKCNEGHVHRLTIMHKHSQTKVNN